MGLHRSRAAPRPGGPGGGAGQLRRAQILGNQTDLPIAEHATDTAGATLINFALFDLVGMQLSPRIRDLGRITLCRTGSKAEAAVRYPHAGPLLTRRANASLVAEHWDDLLRLAASLKFGHATASLVVGKLSASGAQNTTPSGGRVENPSLLARVGSGVDGQPPTAPEHRALRQAVSFATINSNPWWTPGVQSWDVATADNADLWVQPVDLADGSITLERGRRVRALAGGYSVADEDFSIPAPLELHLPFGVRLDEDLVAAAYETLLHPAVEHADRARRIAVAMHWVTKSWFNSASLSESDQLVFLKTGSEALTGETRMSHVAGARLQALFCGALSQEGDGLGVRDLLWSPNEPIFTRTWTNRSGATEQADVSAIEHWYGELADARNAVVHALGSPKLVYEQAGSAYSGPLVEIGDRVMREAICVELGACGYPDVWRRSLTRASMAALRQLRAQERS